jgi:hypothetical protein
MNKLDERRKLTEAAARLREACVFAAEQSKAFADAKFVPWVMPGRWRELR